MKFDKVLLFTTPRCTRCPLVKKALNEIGIKFTELNLEEPSVLADARSCYGIFSRTVPIVCAVNSVGGGITIMTEVMFKGDKFDKTALDVLL